MSVEAPEAPEAVAPEATPTPETPEAPAPEATVAPAGDEPAAADTSTAAARARDEKGRFTKAEREAAEALAAAEPTVAPVVASPPAPSAPPPAMPWTFRAGGQRIPIQGATVSPEGTLQIPADQVPNIRQLLGEGMAYRTTFRQKEQEWQTKVESAGAVEKARAEKYNEAAVMLWGMIENPETLRALAENPERVELLKERLALKLQASDLRAPRPTVAENQQDPAAEQQAFQQAAREAFDEELDDFLEHPAYKQAFTGDELQKLKDRMGARWTAYFTDEQGETVLDRHALKAELDYEAGLRRTAQEHAAKLADLAAKNAAKQVTAPAVPSVVPAKGSPAPSDTPAKKDKLAWAREHGL